MRRKRRRRSRCLLRVTSAFVQIYLGLQFVLSNEAIHRFPARFCKTLKRNLLINWTQRSERLRRDRKFSVHGDFELPVRIISLQRATDRLLQTPKSVQEQGLHFELFKAVDGLAKLNATDVQLFAGKKKRRRLEATSQFDFQDMLDLHTKLTSSPSMSRQVRQSVHERLRFGCYMSHVYLWRNMLMSDIPFLIILEDDVRLENNFSSKLRSQLSTLPQTWGLLYLNGCFRRFGEVWSQGIRVSRGGLCTYGYVISRSAARSLVTKLALMSDQPVDHMMDSSVVSGQLIAFHSDPQLVTVIEQVSSTLAYM